MNKPKEIVENIDTEEDLTAITESKSSETITNTTTVNTIELEDASTTITKIKTNNENTITLRKNATKNLENQADKMKKLSDKKFLPVEIGSTVRVPVPDVDKGRLDARNILAVVTEITDDGFYRLGTKNGTLRQVYARSQFTVCQKKLLHLDEVPAEELALRSVASQQSTGSGQGFTKCTCKTRCQSKKCLCVKNEVLCNSRCHSSLTCCNK